MRGALLLAAVGAAALGLGIVVGSAARGTETTTVVVTEKPPGLPEAVEQTRAALLAGAKAGDYEALRPLLPAAGFSYSFGGEVEGGPIAYWQSVERSGPERPLETLATLLELPYVLTGGTYVWPFAHALTSASQLSAHERALLERLGEVDGMFDEGVGYLYWRTGITADGTWTFFVAGD